LLARSLLLQQAHAARQVTVNANLHVAASGMQDRQAVAPKKGTFAYQRAVLCHTQITHLTLPCCSAQVSNNCRHPN
jgi:hypothetical protein